MTPGKKALITGGSSPLAIDLGHKLFDRGYTVFLTSRSSKHLQQAKKIFPCSLFTADISTLDGQHSVISWIKKEAPDLVINSAGLGFYGDTIDLEDADLCELCEVNMVSLLLFSKAAAEAMRLHQKEGVIVNISSATDKIIYPTFAAYAASKSFVTSFSLAFAEEVKKYAITVLVASPGQIQTRFQERASKGSYTQRHGLTSEKAAAEIIKMIENKQRYHVFPCKIKFLRSILSAILPQKIFYYLLKKKLKNRIPR